MAIRVYICPWVGSGTRIDPYRSKAVDFGYQVSTFFPSKLDGTPASTWVLSFIRSNEFSGIDADTSCDDLFQGDLPGTIQTKDDLISFLRTRTLGDIPTNRRNAIQGVLDKYLVPRSDFTLTTPVWKLVQRTASTLFEKDDNWGSSF